jgi:hypothetical protein
VKKARFASEVAAMITRWNHMFADDPAYTPNLSLGGSHFELSYPPRFDPVWPPLRCAGMRGVRLRALGASGDPAGG